MTNLSNTSIIGSGPTALYLLNNIWNNIDSLKNHMEEITIFEMEKISGMGMPYHPNNTDIYNLANISSEEIPMLTQSFGDWLRKQKPEELKKFNINNLPIDDSDVYSRIALGYYFQEQFRKIILSLESRGIKINQHCSHEIIDISNPKKNHFILTDRLQVKHQFSTVVIANGHVWKEQDKVEFGYFANPWPIHKILPKNEDLYNFPVGTLGASLSAFDVVTSLAHRHGKFIYVDGKLKYIKRKDASNFEIVLHSAEGWLPHLQYEQQEPLREIYRHFTRNQLLELIDDNGVMRIEDFFDKLCRPALISAFTKDNFLDVVDKLQSHNYSFKNLVELMSEKHQYINSFEGMKSELITARDSVDNKIPIYWMETLDDLMYSLNYHCEILPAEDHIFFHKEIMSFLMNVIAALPLQSAAILLALYDAKSITLKDGLVTFNKDAFSKNTTKISVKKENGDTEELNYRLFINCSGQKKLDIEDYPFPTLVEEGAVCNAFSKFANPEESSHLIANLDYDKIVHKGSDAFLKLSGIDIDSSYRTINKNGTSNSGLYDINFTHTNGLRPYSYGLQACNATSLILVESWVEEFTKGNDISSDIQSTTELYEDNEDL